MSKSIEEVSKNIKEIAENGASISDIIFELEEFKYGDCLGGAISLIEKRVEELIDYNELSATHGAIKDHQLILERIKEL